MISRLDRLGQTNGLASTLKHGLELALLAPHSAPSLVPHRGARLYIARPKVHPDASIYVSPGDGLSRVDRRLAEKRLLVMCHILGRSVAEGEAPHVLDFCPVTLRWAFGRSHRIAIISDARPVSGSGWTQWLLDSANTIDRARFITTIETIPAGVLEWQSAIGRWARKNASVRVFDRKIEEHNRKVDEYKAVLGVLD